MSGSKFGERGGGCGPKAGGNESLEVIRLHGERLNTSEERGLAIEEKRLIRSSQGIVLERIKQIPDDGAGLEGSPDARLRRAVPGVGKRGVLVGVQEPNGVVKGEILKRREATPRNAPQSSFGRGTVRERQEIFVSPVPVLHEREPVVENREFRTQIEELLVEAANVSGGVEVVQ